MPVADAVVPASLREKFGKNATAEPAPNGSDISLKKGKDAFFDLMFMNGWDNNEIEKELRAYIEWKKSGHIYQKEMKFCETSINADETFGICLIVTINHFNKT